MRGDDGMKTREGGVSLPRREASEETSPANTSNLDFQPPELGENTFCHLSRPGRDTSLRPP